MLKVIYFSRSRIHFGRTTGEARAAQNVSQVAARVVHSIQIISRQPSYRVQVAIQYVLDITSHHLLANCNSRSHIKMSVDISRAPLKGT